MTATVPRKSAAASPHMVIRASAGAGKTFTLSNRYLKLLRQGATPQEILATTFTRKAAGEILGRVLLRLADAASSSGGAATLAEQLRDPRLDLAEAQRLLGLVAGGIHLVAISTLDAFFHRMAGCFRYELGLPRDPRIMDEHHPSVRRLRREAIDAMLGDDAPDVLVGLLRRLHHDAAQRRITDAIDDIVVGMYPIYRQTSEAAWHRMPVPATLDKDQLQDALAALRDAEGSLPGVQWAKAWAKELACAERSDWDGFLAGGIAGKLAAGEETYYKKPIPKALASAYHPLVVHARASIVKRVAEQTEATHALLHRFHAHYARLRREQGVLLFADLPLLLSNQVSFVDEDDSLESLYFRLDGRVQHLLLDEFQDTSPLQWAILRPFAEEIRAGEGSAREGGAERSFFCVGDVKQSIYGWRDGCAEIFDQVMEDLHFDDAVVHRIAKSYRSSQVVLDVVNRVFDGIESLPPLADIRPQVECWAKGFETHTAAKTLKGYVRVAASPAVAEGEEGGAAHLDFVAQDIAELHGSHPTRTVGVLVRKNDTASAIIHKLRELGVTASGEGGSKLTSDAAVETILSALTLADHPGHTAAAHHVRHSPLWAALDGGDEIGELSRAIRRDLLDHGYGGAIARWARALAAHCNARSVERLTQLIELAEAYDAGAGLRAREFVRYVEATAVEDPAPSPVRVMTVHKAKGLEFDLVVLPELGDLIGQVHRAAVWQYRETPTAASSAVLRSVSQELRPILEEFDHSGVVAAAHEQEVRRRTADDLSALYVAMTRPKHALHILLEPLTRTKAGWGTRGLSNRSYASIVRHALCETDPPAEDGVLFEHGDAAWDDAAAEPAEPRSAGRARRERVEVRLARGPARRAWSVVTPSRLTQPRDVRAADLLSLDGHLGRRRGTALHDALAKVEWLDGGVTPEELRDVLAKPGIRAIFTKPATPCELWRERPFAVQVDGKLVQGRFDRVHVEPGRATLIDFKTDRVDAKDAHALAETYRPQVEAYRAALARMLHLAPSAVTARLAFTAPGVTIDL